MNPSQAAYLVLMVYGLLLLVILMYLYIKAMSRDTMTIAHNTGYLAHSFERFVQRIEIAAGKPPCGCEDKETKETPAPGGEGA